MGILVNQELGMKTNGRFIPRLPELLRPFNIGVVFIDKDFGHGVGNPLKSMIKTSLSNIRLSHDRKLD